jgi:tetratricopeptide (TPR) repeat protein
MNCLRLDHSFGLAIANAMPQKWSQSDEKGLAYHIDSGSVLPPHFSLPTQVNRTELLMWNKRQLAEEIYNMLLTKSIMYSPEPAHDEPGIQLIRTPKEILEIHREGTCLDLATLYCGLCQAVGLLPLIIVLKKHALAAVSLHYSRQDYWDADSARQQERSLFQKDPVKNIDSLRNLLSSQRFIFIECTGFAHAETTLSESRPEGMQRQEDGTLTFERAVEAGAEQLEQIDRPLEFALDVTIAHWHWKIKQDVVYPNPRSPQLSAPSRFKQLVTSGYQSLEDKNFGRAEEQFDLSRKLNKEAPDPWLGKAHIAFVQDNLDVALKFVDKALQRESSHWQSLALKIKLLLLLGGNNREEAMKLANRSLGLQEELDAWLKCLISQKVFDPLVTTASTLDATCPFPKSFE